jgi:uncharacterized protein YjiS (DUF1127 family)
MNAVRTQTAPFGAITAYRAVAFVENVVESFRAARSAARTRRALSRLTPRELADIGVHDIDAAVASVLR